MLLYKNLPNKKLIFRRCYFFFFPIYDKKPIIAKIKNKPPIQFAPFVEKLATTFPVIFCDKKIRLKRKLALLKNKVALRLIILSPLSVTIISFWGSCFIPCHLSIEHTKQFYLNRFGDQYRQQHQNSTLSIQNHTNNF